MGQLLVGFALGWLAFTKEGKEVAEKFSNYLSKPETAEKKAEDEKTSSPTES